MNKKYQEPEKFERTKIKRKRKPMTPEQKLAAGERLRKAREAKGPAKNLSVHETIRDLDEEHYLNPNKVKMWIKTWQEKRLGMKIRAGGGSAMMACDENLPRIKRLETATRVPDC